MQPMNLAIPRLALGMSSSEMLRVLMESNPSLAALFVFAYQHPPLLQQRLALTQEEVVILDKAIAVRSETGLPFWDTLLLSCFDEQRDCTRLLAEAKFHQSHRASMQRITRADVLSGQLTRLAGEELQGVNWSFSSSVEMSDGRFVHFPLLDFHCPETPNNDGLVAAVCKQLFRSSVFVFVSGESYHAVGTGLLDEAGLRGFLIESLFFSPIIDRAYVTHQLLESTCALRLHSSASKPNTPKLKCIIDVKPAISAALPPNGRAIDRTPS